MNDLQLQSLERHTVANSPNSLYHIFLVNMTDTDSFGAPRPLVALPPYVSQAGSEILSGRGAGWREGTRERGSS